ncbi:3-dehydrosphinganine reductase tsc10a, partial [Stylosanthes scabra]|nr:3-dehydrosphinganine reductase tsc10a [Stylosanthes scabra]
STATSRRHRHFHHTSASYSSSFNLAAPLSGCLLLFFYLTFLYFIVRPRPIKITINNRHVFNTDGSKGIGLAFAHRAVVEGARVNILAQSRNKLEEACNAVCLATGIEFFVFAVDIRDYDIVKHVMDEDGPIDVLLLNHGVFVVLVMVLITVNELQMITCTICG